MEPLRLDRSSDATASSAADVDDLPLVQRLPQIQVNTKAGGSSAAGSAKRESNRQRIQEPLHTNVDAALSGLAHRRPVAPYEHASANFTGFGRVQGQGIGPPAAAAVATKRPGQPHTSDLFAQAEAARCAQQ